MGRRGCSLEVSVSSSCEFLLYRRFRFKQFRHWRKRASVGSQLHKQELCYHVVWPRLLLLLRLLRFQHNSHDGIVFPSQQGIASNSVTLPCGHPRVQPQEHFTRIFPSWVIDQHQSSMPWDCQKPSNGAYTLHFADESPTLMIVGYTTANTTPTSRSNAATQLPSRSTNWFCTREARTSKEF